jgi:hypothetical protein
VTDTVAGPPWSERAHCAADLARIAEFRDSTRVGVPDGVRSGTPRYFTWKLAENPFGAGIARLAVDPADTFVGVATWTPKPVRVDGALTMQTELGDAMTRADYQRRGIFGTLVAAGCGASLRAGASAVYSTPTRGSASYRAMLRHGFAEQPAIDVLSLVRPMRAARLLRDRLGRLPTPLRSPLAAAAGAGVDAALRLGGRPRLPRGLEVRRDGDLIEDCAAVYSACSGQHDWIVERSPEYLRWRFRANPDAYEFVVVTRAGRPVGYSVSRIGPRQGLRTFHLADFLATDRDVLRALTRTAIDDAADCDVITAWVPRGGTAFSTLRAAGFLQHKEISIILHPGSAEAPRLPVRGWFTLADSDNI